MSSTFVTVFYPINLFDVLVDKPRNYWRMWKSFAPESDKKHKNAVASGEVFIFRSRVLNDDLATQIRCPERRFNSILHRVLLLFVVVNNSPSVTSDGGRPIAPTLEVLATKWRHVVASGASPRNGLIENINHRLEPVATTCRPFRTKVSAIGRPPPSWQNSIFSRCATGRVGY